MNTEEKAKAYDEALEDMRVIYPNLKGDAKLAVEHAFPELAESEDERIRKAIKRYIENVPDTYRFAYGVGKKEMLSYIKKQKINTEGDFGRGYNCGYEACLNSHGAEWFEKQNEPNYTKRNALFDKCVENCDPEIMKRVSDEIDAELQKEQKPASGNSEKPNDHLINAAKIAANVAKKFIQSQKTPDFPLGGIISSTNFPSEWGEGDNNALEFIHELISFGYTKNFFDAQTAADMRVWLNTRLKSLCPQPHWKPSEEQMDWLATAVRLSADKPAIHKVIASLYNDLEKLM